jgi:hypothetical protein
MAWWSKSAIPYRNLEFQSFINAFIFECPVCIRKKVKVENMSNKKSKSETKYQPVSARDCSFKNRGITGNLLTTILARIRKPLVINNAYAVIEPTGNIEVKVQSIIETTDLSDINFELMVYKTRSEMPDTEAIFYYIRNSFAHGSFEIINQDGENIYLLESSKDKDIKAQMRLKATTLNYYVELANLSNREISSLQKKRNRKKTHK